MRALWPTSKVNIGEGVSNQETMYAKQGYTTLSNSIKEISLLDLIQTV